ncbi:hypothetical protein JOC85_002074 [Bacillus mesophilus]|uniref:DUF4025 domain-containing protein n=1 Tax=Bacillus mesophilus TaxID=1808955 RepID=A0A6M0Q460_9BACI|nr:hypothetical protein [Bacillus mesophilus]NEY71177.1 DUF4025 domain-containing protein [Bacillus mesophilus]
MEKNDKVAGKQYDPSFYKNANDVEAGLATTHEQASDSYMEGTIDGNIDDLSDESTAIPRTQE